MSSPSIWGLLKQLLQAIFICSKSQKTLRLDLRQAEGRVQSFAIYSEMPQNSRKGSQTPELLSMCTPEPRVLPDEPGQQRNGGVVEVCCKTGREAPLVCGE